VDIDLTRDQFSPTQIVGTPTLTERPSRHPRRCRQQYEELHRRVFAALGLTPILDVPL
jgi:hypothetical protein